MRISGPAIVVTLASLLIVVAVTLGIRHSYSVSTPSAAEAPAPQGTPIVQGSVIGKVLFADGDTASGGRGQTVGGIECNIQEMLAKHQHAHLTLFFDGVQAALPKFVGIVMKPQNQGCIYWLHTHDATGLIHIESPDPNGTYTLGQFFAIWGQELAPDDIAGHTGAVHAYVDGMAYQGDLRAIPLAPRSEITLEVGKPVVAPPLYAFPEGL
ncbi:hypothetical protein EPN44_09795 [bacterium]|nr:MAG: hypothetical protein EPN44_09795 [bacterium]